MGQHMLVFDAAIKAMALSNIDKLKERCFRCFLIYIIATGWPFLRRHHTRMEMTVSIKRINPAYALTTEFLLTQQRIINSHPDFNYVLSGQASLSLIDIKNETQDVIAMGGQYFMIRLGDVCVGIGHWLASNPYDKHPWIGLLVIEQHVTGKGIGRYAVQEVINYLADQNEQAVRLFVQVNNSQGFSFWTQNGFHPIDITADEYGRDAYTLELTAQVNT